MSDVGDKEFFDTIRREVLRVLIALTPLGEDRARSQIACSRKTLEAQATTPAAALARTYAQGRFDSPGNAAKFHALRVEADDIAAIVLHAMQLNFGGQRVHIARRPGQAKLNVAKRMTVAQLIAETGVSRSRAYQLMKQARSKS